MSGLFLAILLALLTAIGLVMAARRSRAGWEPVAAALLIGLAGYAWQGHPGLAGKPAFASAERSAMFDEKLAEKRRAMGERMGPASKWLVLSDGLARQGRTQDAANVLVSALRDSPNDPDLWVGLGNALVLHEGGLLSPAAEHAYQQARRLAPSAPSPRYFYALALAQSGKLQAARDMWADLGADMPEGTPFRLELDRNVTLVDRMLASQGSGVPTGR